MRRSESLGEDFRFGGYDRSQRCYQIEKLVVKAVNCELKLSGARNHPLSISVPCPELEFQGAKVRVDGKEFNNSRVGINHELGGDDLMVFLFLKATSAVNISIDRVD